LTSIFSSFEFSFSLGKKSTFLTLIMSQTSLEPLIISIIKLQILQLWLKLIAVGWNLGSNDDELYTELWKACAGPLVEVPRYGERVFYFPQGHMEQVKNPNS